MYNTCPHCKTNLDAGDIFENFLNMFNDSIKALQYAKSYGWKETDKIHFSRSIIVQPDRDPQYITCPDCKQKLPDKFKTCTPDTPPENKQHL